MISVIIDYATISPAVLSSMITKACMNAVPMYKEVNEECFEIQVCGWLPMTPADLVKVQEVLAPFI